MTTVIKMLPYQIVVSDSGYPSLRTADGSPWTDADSESSDLMLLELIIKMHKLLVDVNEDTHLYMGADPASCESINAVEAFLKNEPT